MATHNWVIGSLFLVAILFVLRMERRAVESRSLALMRVLFPSWRFFEAIAPAPTLSHRVVDGAGEFGPWLDTLPPVPRPPWFWAFHPAGNLRLACASLVEHLAHDLDDGPRDGITAQVSYQLVQRLVESRLRGAHRYQFRLLSQDEPHAEFVSDVHEVES